MLRTTAALLLTITTLLVSTANAEIYRWVDKNGKVHFSDKKPQHKPASTIDINQTNTYQNIELKPLGPSSVKSSNKRNRGVVMYSAEWCGYCKVARNYFQSNKIPFKEYDIDKNEKARQEYQELGGKGVPLILVGKKKMSGFTQQRFESLYNRKK
ncbi:glutaredoxin family protein [Spartinivicinus ruber]|uniref:glutaredoxin family protein n=1 Tax=Spartinivicinus ruber TaxID=2683272 RepID=UPI0013D09B12|nr:glutaredoxin family protein [Spartinivicinus ruber]